MMPILTGGPGRVGIADGLALVLVPPAPLLVLPPPPPLLLQAARAMAATAIAAPIGRLRFMRLLSLSMDISGAKPSGQQGPRALPLRRAPHTAVGRSRTVRRVPGGRRDRGLEGVGRPRRGEGHAGS